MNLFGPLFAQVDTAPTPLTEKLSMSSRHLLLIILGASLASCSRDSGKLKQQYVANGDRYAAKKDYNAAIIEYRKALAQDNLFGQARYKLAMAYESVADVSNAYNEYIRAADVMPDNVEAQLRAGAMRLAAGEYPEAKARALAALARDPKNVNALVLMGNALAGLKDLDGAIKQIQEAIDEADPNVRMTYANLGMLQLAKGQRPAAETAFKRAVEVDSKSIGARLNLGGFYWAGNQLADAEREFKGAVAVDPK